MHLCTYFFTGEDMTKDEALKLALEALEGVLDDAPKVLNASIAGGLYEVIQCRDAITAIKEALAQDALDRKAENARELGLDYEPVAWSHAGAMPPEQEEMKEAAYQLAPWLSAALDDPKVCKEYKDVINAWFDAAMPAPQRTWVGLTDEEIKAAIPFKDLSGEYYYDDVLNIILFIQAKLRSKND